MKLNLPVFTKVNCLLILKLSVGFQLIWEIYIYFIDFNWQHFVILKLLTLSQKYFSIKAYWSIFSKYIYRNIYKCILHKILVKIN